MAVIVPILMYASGAAATIGAAIGLSATMVSSVVGLAFQVSGINNKINQAASKVFGEDLVNVVNIAGAVYGAVGSGAFDFGRGVEAGVELAGPTLGKAVLDGTASFGSHSVDFAGAADAAAGLAGDSLSLAGPTLTKAALDGTSATSSAEGVFNLAEQAGWVPDTGAGLRIPATDRSVGLDPRALEKVWERKSLIPEIAARPQVSDTLQNTASRSVLADAAANPKAVSLGQTATKPGSFFERLLSNDKAVGELVKGVGGGISSAATAKAEKERLDFAKEKYRSVSTYRAA